MKKIISLVLIVVFTVTSVFADVYVKGYTKKNGTYVAPHYRSSPDSSPYNNWSYPGNTNPYTGKTAGGSESTYLENYYNNSYSLPSYTAPSYTAPSYTAPSYSLPSSYVSPYTTGSSRETVYGGYKSYGILFCDSGYYKNLDSCVIAPSNSTAYGGTSFFCNTGYKKNSLGNLCLSKDESCKENHGGGTYYDQSTNDCRCGVGYKLSLDRTKCIQEIQCADYEIKNNDSCVSQDQACVLSFGQYSVAVAGSKKGNQVNCQCAYGFEWTTDQKSCIPSANKPKEIVATSPNNALQDTSTNTGKKISIVFDRDLKFGSRGNDVKQLQKVLQHLGYLSKTITANGYFGKATKSALENFQKEENLTVNGILDDDTKVAIIEKAVGYTE